MLILLQNTIFRYEIGGWDYDGLSDQQRKSCKCLVGMALQN